MLENITVSGIQKLIERRWVYRLYHSFDHDNVIAHGNLVCPFSHLSIFNRSEAMLLLFQCDVAQRPIFFIHFFRLCLVNCPFVLLLAHCAPSDDMSDACSGQLLGFEEND